MRLQNPCLLIGDVAARDCFQSRSKSRFGVLYVSLFYFFPTSRSSGLAEREPQFNFDKYEIELLRCKGVTKGRMVWRSAFVSPRSLYFPFGD
jgi:hypothetical protein